jgi:hypothetical protein
MAESAAASAKSSLSRSVTRRRSGSTGISRGRQLAKAIIVGLGGVALGALVVKTSATYALVDSNPYAASRFAPNDPRVTLNIALVEFILKNGALSHRTQERALAALAKAPLAETPMLVAAVSALAAGDTSRGEALLVEARHREPRFLLARLLLLDRYLKTDRVDAAAAEIAVLTRLAPETGGLLVPQLANMAAKPRTGANLMQVLRHDTKLQQEVLARLASSADPDTVLRLAREAPPAAGTSADWQDVLLNRLVTAGDFSRAYALWRSFAGMPADSGEKNIYDGRFQGLRGAAPFNWKLNTTSAGVAERSSSGALQVQYFGREASELASQLIMLRPGNYRFRIRAEGDASGDGSRIGWSLSCVQGSQLFDLPVVKVNSNPRLLEARFAVPMGCQSQWLRLSGTPAEFPTEQDATLRDARIEKVGS